jgi:folate-binding protein YgfZ
LLIADNEISIERDNLLNSEDWFLDDINNKNFEISIKSIGMFTPHELGYHLSSRVDFEKGCYTGQEIVARMHYRAKKLPSLIIKTSANYQEDFSKIYDHTKTAIGTVLSCVEHGAIFHYLISTNKNFKEQEFEI